MLAFTRKPPDDDSPAAIELLLDGDDDLAPLTTPAPADPDDAEPSSTRLIVAPRWTQHERDGYSALARFACTREPQLGWRHVLFVVTGICIDPSGPERALRSHVAALLRSVDPLLLNDDKEAAS